MLRAAGAEHNIYMLEVAGVWGKCLYQRHANGLKRVRDETTVDEST